jgi:lipopolysaccharide assembly outer membrane protein LptD (OstA)
MYGYKDDGTLLWSSRAKAGRLVDGRGTMSEVAMSFFADEVERLAATGKTLTYSGGGGRLEGDVTVARDDGLRIETDALAWDEATQIIDAGPIRVSYEGMALSAGALQYDLREERSRFSGGVELIRPGEKAWSIVCRQAEERAGTLTLTGDVQVDIGSDRYTCSRLTTATDGETVRLTGGVTAEFADGRLEAERLDRQADGSLSAAGGVRLQLDLGKSEESNGA